MRIPVEQPAEGHEPEEMLEITVFLKRGSKLWRWRVSREDGSQVLSHLRAHVFLPATLAHRLTRVSALTGVLRGAYQTEKEYHVLILPLFKPNITVAFPLPHFEFRAAVRPFFVASLSEPADVIAVSKIQQRSEKQTKHTPSSKPQTCLYTKVICNLALVSTHTHSLTFWSLHALCSASFALPLPRPSTLTPGPCVAEVRLSAFFLRREFSVVLAIELSVVFAFEFNFVFAFLPLEFSVVCGFVSFCSTPAARFAEAVLSVLILCSHQQ
jgi:hypothetical protein